MIGFTHKFEILKHQISFPQPGLTSLRIVEKLMSQIGGEQCD